MLFQWQMCLKPKKWVLLWWKHQLLSIMLSNLVSYLRILADWWIPVHLHSWWCCCRCGCTLGDTRPWPDLRSSTLESCPRCSRSRSRGSWSSVSWRKSGGLRTRFRLTGRWRPVVRFVGIRFRTRIGWRCRSSSHDRPKGWRWRVRPLAAVGIEMLKWINKKLTNSVQRNARKQEKTRQ